MHVVHKFVDFTCTKKNKANICVSSPPPSKEKLYEVEVYEIGMVPTSQVCSQNIQRLHL